jgi:hypothetical protein
MMISLNKATLWQGRRQIGADLTIKEIMRNCNIARNLGKTYSEPRGLSDLLDHLDEIVKGEQLNPLDIERFNVFSKNIFPYVSMFVKTVLSRNVSELCISVQSLIGFGPGFTPSCDDMLVGFMGSLVLVTEALRGDIHYAFQVNRAIISLLNGQTTSFSQELLEHAAQGELPELTYNVVEAIATGTEEKVRRFTSKLLGVGHSSGMDNLLGVLLGFYVLMRMMITN